MAQAPATDAREAMERMYRWQRHIYDATRKFYLFGRDVLIRELKPAPGEAVIEIGCGTARNLIALAKRHPDVQFFGVDAAQAMLDTAAEEIAKAGLGARIRLAHGLAQDVTPAMVGRDRPFDRVLFSYALSIMDDWAPAVDAAVAALKPGGTIHVVDFGNQEGLPGWFKRLLGTWLAQFHVRFRPEVQPYFEALAARTGGTVRFRSHMRGYAYLLEYRSRSA